MLCFRQVLCSLGSGQRGAGIALAILLYIVYLCGVNRVEDEAAGISSQILPSIAEKDLNRTILKEFFT